MKRLLIIIVISLFAFYSSAVFAEVLATSATGKDKRIGKISGIILDESTQQPLVGVNVSVIDTELQTVTDNQGQFSIPNLPIGTYQLKALRIGYETLVKTDVVVSTGRDVHIVIQLKEMVFQLEEVTVQADYFYKDPEVSTSLHTFDREEIRRAPGSVEDINRVMMSMPGVASTSDQINELVVRGGNPIENLTILDNIELSNSNHFGEIGGTGGPIGMINVDFIRESNFYTGGFPAKYGDKLSSVLDIKLREGNRRELATDIDLSMAGVGGILEGPLVRGKGSWLLSYRKSYLDLLKGQIGLTAIPQYSDLQGKVTYDLTPKHKLSLVGIGGIDHINITEGDEDAYSRGVDWVLNDVEKYGVGLNWQALFSRKGYSVLTLSQTFNKFLVDVRDEDDSQVYLDKSWERETAVKGEMHYNFNPGNQFTTGFKAMVVNFEHNTRSKDWEFYSDEADAVITLPGLRLDEQVQSYKAAAYLHHNWTPSDRLNLKGGLRFDYFDYTQAKNVSPRFGVSYELTPKTTLNGSFGFFYQTPPYIWLTLDPKNKELKNLHANHYVIGLERLFRNDLKFTIEFYNKDYDNYPIRHSDATRILINDGEGYGRGVDIFLQKKLSGALYGLVSYSYSIARAKTPKTGEFDWDYDYRHVFTLIAGYRLSNKWEISGKWRYMGGRPYTPIIDSFKLAPGDWEPIYDEKHPNSKRYPPYHRLDLRFDRRFHFKSWNLITYFEVENIYNRRNIWSYRWNRDERKNDSVYQFGFFPVGGFRVEF